MKFAGRQERRPALASIDRKPQLMGDVINAAGRFRGGRIVPGATHKFAVGASVIHRIGHKSEKVLFRIVRLLPDGGQGLQYRLKSDADGHERVTFEASLEKPEPENIAT